MALIGNQNARWTGTQTRDDKEFVLDEVIDLAPTQTPLLQLLPRGERARNIKREWVLDYLGAYPSTSSDIKYADEGDDFDPQAASTRTLLFNYTQILRKEYGVTRTQQTIGELGGLFGVEDELGYQAERNAKDLLRQLEWTLINGTLTAEANTSPNDSANAGRKAGGVNHFIGNVSSYYSVGTLATAAQPYSQAAGTTLDVDDIESAYAQVAENGGVRDGRHLAFCPSSVKRIVNRLFSPPEGSTSIYRRDFGGSESLIDVTVDVIQTDFGRLDLMWHLAAPANTLIAFEPGYWELNILDDLQVVEIAKTADSTNEAVLIEPTWSFLGPNTFWRITGITA